MCVSIRIQSLSIFDSRIVILLGVLSLVMVLYFVPGPFLRFMFSFFIIHISLGLLFVVLVLA